MSAPAVVVPSGTSIAAAARIMDHEGVKRLPVVDDLGRLVGVVSRGDLLKVHLRPDDEILQDVKSTVLRPFLVDNSPIVHATVQAGVVTISGRVDRWSAADLMPRLARQVPGVVQVDSTLDYDLDDRKPQSSPGMIISIA